MAFPRWLVLITLGLALLGLVACSEDSGSATSSSGGSAGTGAGGWTGGAGGAAGTAGAAGGGGVGAACTGSGPVTMQLVQYGAPSSGYVVVFHHVDGSVAAELVTDTDGKAQAMLECGGLVTLAVGTTVLYTVRAEPGDTIVLDGGEPPDYKGIGGDMELQFAGSVSGAATYPVGCVGPPSDFKDLALFSGAKIPIRKNCLNGVGKFHELAVAHDAQGKPLAFTFVKDITPAAPALTTVTMPMPWRTDFSTLTLDASGVPAAFNGVSLGVRPWLDGLTYVGDGGSAFLASGSGSVKVKYPPDFGSALLTAVDASAVDKSLRLWRRLKTPVSSLALKATDWPPALSDLTLDSSTAGRPIASFLGDTKSADGVMLAFSYAPDGTSVKTWNVFVPPGTTSFRFPDLPASLAPLAPLAGTKLFGLEVSALSSSEIDGPADFRQHHVLRAWTHAVAPALNDVTLATVRKQPL